MKRKSTEASHKVATREEWLAARLELLKAEKEHTRRGTGVDWTTFLRERPGVSAFVLEDGSVYHTYSAYARGVDGLWGMFQWLDRAPKGRNETGHWWRRHDEYDKQ